LLIIKHFGCKTYSLVVKDVPRTIVSQERGLKRALLLSGPFINDVTHNLNVFNFFIPYICHDVMVNGW
jgi:hypothetical protein